MISREYVLKMVEYNAWMNAKVYEAAACLGTEELHRDRGAFFASILGTLNHLTVADTIWLKRFARYFADHAALAPASELPVPSALNAILFDDFAELRHYRIKLDDILKKWASELTEKDLSHILHYTNMQGVKAEKPLQGVLMHFFNHQTHHRGQVTTLLSQAGQDVGVTDLIMLVPNIEQP